MYHIVPHDAHAEVAKMCMRYISVFLKQGLFRSHVTRLESFPMLSYVLSSGFNHIAHVDPESIPVLETLQSLGSDVRHHPSHWDCLWELREEDLRWPYPLWPSSRHDFELYILIAYSSPALLQSFLSSCRLLKPRFGTNPLVYAADLRKTGHAIVLLAYGADVNMGGLAIDDSHRALPLEVSIDRGEDVLVGELLKRGCLVTSELLATTVCLPWCSTRVLAKLMQTDEFVEWAYEIGDEKLYRGVFNTARPDAGDSRKTDEDHVVLARRLRQIGQDLSADSPFGAELIKQAVHAAHTSMLEFLLPWDQPPPSRLLLAVSTGETPETVSVVRFLLDKGVDVQAVSDRRRDTALHLTAMCSWEPRSLELTKLLVAAGCSPHVHNSRGETPLAIAVGRGYISVVEFLLSCNVSLPSDILHVALRRRQNLQMIQWLVLRGANVHAITSSADTVLHLAILGHQEYDLEDEDEYEGDDSHEDYKESERLDLVKSFIEAGCDPTACNSAGQTVLEAATQRGYTSVVEHLLLCSVPFPPDILPTTLQRRSTPQMVEFLIRNGVDVHSTTGDGDTILHLAIAGYPERTCLDLVKNFVNTGCSPTAHNSKGKTVLEAAVEREYASVVEHLLSCNVPVPPNILPIALGRRLTPEVAQSLLRKGADVHSTTSDGDTILHLAIAGCHESRCLSLVQSLTNTGCNPTARDSKGKTVLEAAVERGYTSVVEHLLSCDVPLPPDILPIALRRCSTVEMVQSLLRKGADVHSITSDGDTILHLAIAGYLESECLGLVESFINAGCSPTSRNSAGKTVLETAVEDGYSSVVEHLLSSNVLVPPHILPIALGRRLTPKIIRFLSRKGANVHSTASNGDTVLHLAIAGYLESDCLALVKSFLNAGCSLTTCNSAGKTVLDAAVEAVYILVVEHLLSRNVPVPPHILPIALRRRLPSETVQSLLRKCVDIHSTMSDGDTILHLAIAGYPEPECLGLVKSFIRAGCNSGDGNVLKAAIEDGYISVVEHLLSCNVPVPPHILPIALQRRLTPGIIQSMLRNGADVHSTASNGDTILHLVIAGYFESECLDLVKSFTNAGCDLTVCDSEGKTVLEAAIKRRYTSVVEHLLSRNVPLPPHILPIVLRRRRTVQMVQFLLCKGANVHSTASNGDTVLHLAIAGYLELDCLGLVKNFITAGCNPTTCNSAGKTALEAAVEAAYTSVVEHLLSCNVSVPPHILPTALRRRLTPEIIQSLLCKGADVHSITSDGDTILHLAIAWYLESECLVLVRSFIDASCSPIACNYAGKTVLEAATEDGYTSVVEHLLSYNVPVPPHILSIALRRRITPEVVQSLLRKGADVHSTTPKGYTVLHLAIAGYLESECLDLVKIFINAGCSPTAHSFKGKTALKAAIEREYASVVEHLLSCNVPVPPNILPVALRRRLPPEIVQCLHRKGADLHATTSNGDTVLHLAITRYPE